MIIWNTIRFEYYIIQQLFNGVNVPRCHTENISSQNIFIPFKYTLLLFSQFIFSDTSIKGTIFSGRVRSPPSHLPQLRAWELRDYLIQFCWDAVCITCFCLLFILDIQKQPPGVFWKKGVLRNFKINRKTPVPESVFNKVAGLTPATLLKKRLWLMCFPVNFVKFLRTRFLQNTSGRLLLDI